MDLLLQTSVFLVNLAGSLSLNTNCLIRPEYKTAATPTVIFDASSFLLQLSDVRLIEWNQTYQSASCSGSCDDTKCQQHTCSSSNLTGLQLNGSRYKVLSFYDSSSSSDDVEEIFVSFNGNFNYSEANKTVKVLAAGSSLYFTAKLLYPNNIGQIDIIRYNNHLERSHRVNSYSTLENGRDDPKLLLHSSFCPQVDNLDIVIRIASVDAEDYAVGINLKRFDSYSSSLKSQIHLIFNLNISVCNQIVPQTDVSGQKFLNISCTNCTRYNGISNYSCMSPSEMYVKSKLRSSNTFVRTCKFDATWDLHDNVSCYKGPVVNGVNITIIEGNNITFSNVCKIEEGDPVHSSATWSIDGMTYNEFDLVTVAAEHNDLMFYCNASNEFGQSSSAYGVLSVLYVCALHHPVPNGSGYLNITLHVSFGCNPSNGRLTILGPNGYNSTMPDAINGTQRCCGVSSDILCINFANVTTNDAIVVKYHQSNSIRILNSQINKIKNCLTQESTIPGGPITNPVTYTTTEATKTNTVTYTTTEATKNETYALSTLQIALIIFGVLAFFAAVAFIVWRIRKSDSKNAAVVALASSPHYEGQNPEHEERPNVIYDTTDLKSGSEVAKEVVDNILYGTTGPAEVYTQVKPKKNGKAEKNAQKNGKNTQKESDDSGPSTSGIQAEATYAVLDKEKKKKKNKKPGKENPGFSGDVAEDATYSVVNKVNKKKTNGAGKTSDKPSASGGIEECTYAAVDKKSKGKSKKGESDDEDLHGNNAK